MFWYNLLGSITTLSRNKFQGKIGTLLSLEPDHRTLQALVF